MPGAQPYVPAVARYFKAELEVGGDGEVSATLGVRPDLCGPGGLRLGTVVYLTDVVTGICSGLQVQERGEWVVTTDLAVDVVAPVRAGPLRATARPVRVGATTVVTRVDFVDLASGDPVGGGTATNRPFEAAFAGELSFPVGEPVPHDDGSPVGDEPVASQLGITGVDGAVLEVAVSERLVNPWGILHGGVTAVMVDEAAARLTDRVPASMTARYLAPGRAGPVRATPRRLAGGEDGELVEVEVRDRGQGDRLMVLATVRLP